MIKQLSITVSALLCHFVTFSQTYATTDLGCSFSGLCIGSSCSNSSNVTDGNLTNFGNITVVAGVGCSQTISSSFASLQPSGNHVGFYIDDHNVAGVISNLSITVTNSNTSATQTVSGGALVTLLSGGVGVVGFTTTTSFDQVSIQVAGAVGLLQNLDVYYAFSSLYSLPLSFTSFNYQRSNNNLQLQWTTENEVNTQYFSIEKSLDGYSFISLGQVNASGSSSGRYQFSDPSIAKAPVFYRIKQVDQDGRFTYSTVIVVKPGNERLSAWIYPNPVKDVAQVAIYSDKAMLVKIDIVDLSGKLLVSRENIPVYAGSTIIPINTRQLVPGIYMLRTIDAGHSIYSTCKLIK